MEKSVAQELRNAAVPALFALLLCAGCDRQTSQDPVTSASGRTFMSARTSIEVTSHEAELPENNENVRDPLECSADRMMEAESFDIPSPLE